MTACVRITDQAIWVTGTDGEVTEAVHALETVPFVWPVTLVPENACRPGSPAEAYLEVGD